MIYVIPAIFLVVFVFAAVKKVKIYDEFSAGVKEAVSFTIALIPCLAAIFMMCAVFEKSGLSDALTKALAPVFGGLGIPPELTKLVLIKPFSGSGSLTYCKVRVRLLWLVRDGVLYFRRVFCGN